ncbi:hypothetical protein [Azospirillum brasilense]|uniref:hypothetical protein n=1 Tax=Azospirillum brasilense TaxID=192 RepID=UPI001FFE3F88|nr:hypothetical protein [Azospirillum brasilense]
MADATHGTAPVLSFDSLESPGEEGFWLWRDQMSPVFDITLPKEEIGAFRGTLQTYHLGGVLLGRCASVTQTFHRTPPRSSPAAASTIT